MAREQYGDDPSAYAETVASALESLDGDDSVPADDAAADASLDGNPQA